MLTENDKLKEDFHKLLKHSMKYNIIIEDINENEDKNTEELVKIFIKTKLKIEDGIDFQNLHYGKLKTMNQDLIHYSDYYLVLKSVPEI